MFNGGFGDKVSSFWFQQNKNQNSSNDSTNQLKAKMFKSFETFPVTKDDFLWESWPAKMLQFVSHLFALSWFAIFMF